jgi:carbon-monoxide dehydrogenase small subunit
MAFEVYIETFVNGTMFRGRVQARQHLADFLRDELQLTGTHLGCEHGVCGACSLLVDGVIVRSCLMLAAQINGKRVDTIEGMSDNGALAALQEAFAKRNAAQCGFCTSAMLLTAHELLAEKRKMNRAEIREFIAGNFCRCTGYQAIVDAIESVLEQSR